MWREGVRVNTYCLFEHRMNAPTRKLHDTLHQIGCYVIIARWSDGRRMQSREKDLNLAHLGKTSGHCSLARCPTNEAHRTQPSTNSLKLQTPPPQLETTSCYFAQVPNLYNNLSNLTTQSFTMCTLHTHPSLSLRHATNNLSNSF
jgi:hypothetical protein